MEQMKNQINLFENCKYQPNNIYNVDCYKAIKELEDNSIDCVYIDIPYLIQDGGCSQNELSLRMRRLRNVDLKEIKDGIDYSIFAEIVRVMKKVNCFVWCNKQQYYDVMKWFKENTNCFDCEILVWYKQNPSPMCNNVWLPDLEYCLYFREKGVRLNDGYNLKSKHYMSSVNQKDKLEYNHPTIKPLEMVKKHILHTTQENDVVLDCFLGSGTTAVACKELGRKYIGFEIDEKYFRIAQDRLNGISQKDRKAEENGITNIFDFLE